MMSAPERVAKIRERLTAAFAPAQLLITDDSHHHAGHASAKGGGHYTVTVVSSMFAGKRPLERHRMVYAALQNELRGEIHALTIRATTPDEVAISSLTSITS